MARSMVTAMRVAVDKEGEGGTGHGVGACGEEGDGDGGKIDGYEGGGRATATRAMVMEKANNNQPATGLTKAGGGW